jgi:predicted dehydrogenase
VLGLGHAHALGILKTLKASPDFQLAGVCEPDPAMRARFESHALLEGVPWLEKGPLLADPALSMVAVESDVPRLVELGHAVVSAGKHLHLDKPAGTELAPFQALLDTAREQEVLVQMGYMFRYNPAFDFLRTMVSEGALGEIYSIHASMCTDLPPSIRERINLHPGGIMLELGCHLIDMIVLIMGEPRKVTPFLREDTRMGDGLSDNALAVLEYDQAMATVETAAREPNAFAGRRFKIVGTQGSITLSPLEPPQVTLSLREAFGSHPKGISHPTFPDQARHVPDIADLAACIRGEREFAYPKSHDLAVQRTVLRACGDTDLLPA